MTLYEISDSEDPTPDYVRVLSTKVGWGVFACRHYPATAILGKIAGQLLPADENCGEYVFEYDQETVLEPFAPFRYLNHSCEPNCVFEILETSDPVAGSPQYDMYLIANRIIEPSEQLTISYNWGAESAIPCECGSKDCVGWIVCESDLDLIHTVSEYTTGNKNASEVETSEALENSGDELCLELHDEVKGTSFVPAIEQEDPDLPHIDVHAGPSVGQADADKSKYHSSCDIG